jgi:hypothetical protein
MRQRKRVVQGTGINMGEVSSTGAGVAQIAVMEVRLLQAVSANM